MRRFLIFVLLLGALVLPARAETEKYVALTFDDGPSGKFTQALLDGLYEREVHATFLLCGYRMSQYPELTQRIFDLGHEIGYHGYTHDAMQDMSRRSIGDELIDSRELLPEDCEPVFLRPPGGFVTDGIRQVARARQLAILNWSVDPRDWATRDPATVCRSVYKTVKDGDIILLHDMSNSSVTAALRIIDELTEQGYTFVTVSELAKLRQVTLKPGNTYTCFPPREEGLK